MNTTNNIYVQTTALSGFLSQQTLREGSSVYVRILSSLGGTSYIASFAGAKFSVESQTHFLPGTSFTATISFQNGKIILTPQKDKYDNLTSSFVKTINSSVDSKGQITDIALSKYFTSLNLAPDFITLALFNTMKSLGMKFNEQSFKNARRIALQFSGNEKEAAEVALILEQKGINYNSDDVAKIIGYSQSNENKKRDFQNDKQKDKNDSVKKLSEKAKDDDKLFNDIFIEVSNFFSELFGKKNSESKNVLDCKDNFGLLTLFNHKGFKNGGSWIQIPFCLSIDNGEQNADGLLRMYIDEEQNATKKILVKVDFCGNFYYFAIYLNNADNQIFYSSSSNESIYESELLKNTVEKFFCNDKTFSVRKVEKQFISGFFSDEKEIEIVRGSI